MFLTIKQQNRQKTTENFKNIYVCLDNLDLSVYFFSLVKTLITADTHNTTAANMTSL